MEKANGVLAAAFRAEIETKDLAMKEVAAMIHRSEATVFRVLRGEKVGRKTIKQMEIVFPAVFE